MSFPRREFAIIANVDVDVLKSLQRRDQVPLARRSKAEMVVGLSDSEIDARTATRDQSGYSVFEAVMLATADRLTLETSLGRDVARRLVEGWGHSLAKAVRLVEAGEEAWIGAYSEGDAGEADILAIEKKISVRDFDLVVGSLADVVAQVEANLAHVGSEGRAIILLNMKPIVVRTKAAAEQFGFTGSLVG